MNLKQLKSSSWRRTVSVRYSLSLNQWEIYQGLFSCHLLFLNLFSSDAYLTEELGLSPVWILQENEL